MEGKTKIFCNLFIIIGAITQVLSLVLFYFDNYFNGILFGFAYDLATLATIFFLVSYIILRIQKEYYTNKFAAIFVSFFPLFAFCNLIISAKSNTISIIPVIVLTLVYVSFGILFLCTQKKIYYPLCMDILDIDLMISVSSKINVSLVLLYIFFLIANYILIEYPIFILAFTLVTYILFIATLILFTGIFVIKILLYKYDN